MFEAGAAGFRDQLGTILQSCTGSALRRAMFSATLGPEVELWAKQQLDNGVRVRVGAVNSATETVKQVTKIM